MTEPRNIEDRIEWFLSHNPSSTGMCAQHSWHSLGGDYGNPPEWGADDANECVDKVKKSGRYWDKTTWYGDPPVGAWVGYKYGNNGHAAIKHYNDGKIATTDPSNGKMVGIEPLNYPNKWGANGWNVWTDQYNGVKFPVAKSTIYLSKLTDGQTESDSVARLQALLNGISLEGGKELPITGNYHDLTIAEVSKWQKQKATDKSSVNGLFVTWDQAEQLFDSAVFELYNDVEEESPDEPPIEEEQIKSGFGLWKWYSGKPGGVYTLYPDGEWHSLKLSQPASDLVDVESSEHHFLYLRCELDSTRSADKVLETKFIRADEDATAYDHVTFGTLKDSYPYYNIHFEDGSGIGGTWWAKVTGGTSPVEFTTRYAKTHIFYEVE